MRNDKKIIKNAIDSSGFTTGDSHAGYVTPEIWVEQLLPMLRDNLVVASEARTRDDILNAAGDTVRVTVDAVPQAATTVSETSDVSVTAVPSRSEVVYDPDEYGAHFQLSDSQAENSFVQEAQNMQQKLVYSLALAREDEAISVCESNAEHKLYQGDSNTAIADLAAGDTLTYGLIVDAKTKIERDNLEPYVLFTTPEQYATLLKDQQFSYVNRSGGDSELREGTIPQIAGVDVMKSNRLTDDAGSGNDVHKAIMLGRDPAGNQPIGFAPKRAPRVRVDRDEPGRYTEFVATERWDMQSERDEGIALLHSLEG